MPYIAGCEIKDHPLRPICKQCRDKVAALGEANAHPMAHRGRAFRGETGTPDVTIADMIGISIHQGRAHGQIFERMDHTHGLVPRAQSWIVCHQRLRI